MKNRSKRILLLITYCFTSVGMDVPDVALDPAKEVDTFHQKWHPYVVLPTKAFVSSMAYSHDGTKLAVGRSHITTKRIVNAVYIFDTKTWERTILQDCPNATALAYSYDDTSLAVSCNAQKTKIFDTKTCECKKLLKHKESLGSSMLYSPNDEQLVLELRSSPSNMKTKVCIFHTKTWDCLQIFNYDVEMDLIQYSPDSERLFLRAEASETKIFDTKNWECINESVYIYHEILPNVLFSEDENIPAISKQDLKDMKIDSGYKLTAMEWTPDGKQMAMGLVRSKDGEDGAEDYSDGKRGNVCIFVLGTPSTDQQTPLLDQEGSPAKQHIAMTISPASRREVQAWKLFKRFKKDSLPTSIKKS